jgi:N-acetylglutamate synthase-like GNAT family acetyltransferase
MKIKKAKEKDAKEISRLIKNTFKNINAKDYTKKHILSFNGQNSPKKILDKMKERDVFCLLDNNKIIGTIDLEKNKIGGFFIHHNHINKGNGTLLLKFIENYAKKKKIKKVILCSTKYAYKFYLKNNYKLVKKGFWRINNLRFIKYKLEKKLK